MKSMWNGSKKPWMSRLWWDWMHEHLTGNNDDPWSFGKGDGDVYSLQRRRLWTLIAVNMSWLAINAATNAQSLFQLIAYDAIWIEAITSFCQCHRQTWSNHTWSWKFWRPAIVFDSAFLVPSFKLEGAPVHTTSSRLLPWLLWKYTANGRFWKVYPLWIYYHTFKFRGYRTI